MRSLLTRTLGLLAAGRGPARKPPVGRVCPRVEMLETRCVPATFTVRNLEDSGQGSLRQAMLFANAHPDDASTIVFDASLAGTIRLKTALPNIDKSLDIQGPASGAVSITRDVPPDLPGGGIDIGTGGGFGGSGPSPLSPLGGSSTPIPEFRAFTIQPIIPDAVCTISDLTVYGMVDLTGGAIYASDSFGLTVYINDCVLHSNRAHFDGGAIYVLSNFLTSVFIDSSQIYLNTAYYGYGGGIENLFGVVQVTGETSIFSNETVYASGGGIDVFFGTVNILGPVRLYGNLALNGAGGGINNELSSVTMDGGEIHGNHAFYGGGVYVFLGDITLKNVDLTENHGFYGGGFFIDLGGVLVLDTCLVSGNTADGLGDGGINAGGTLYIYHCIILDDIL